LQILQLFFYILSISDECINSGTLQKGTAISRIDDNDGFQIYKFYNYLTSPSNTDSVLNDDNLEVNPSEKKICI